MVKLLSDEAEKAGSSLTESRKNIGRGTSDHEPRREGWRKSQGSDRSDFEAEPWDEFERDPRASVIPCNGQAIPYSNIRGLAEEVSCGYG